MKLKHFLIFSFLSAFIMTGCKKKEDIDPIVPRPSICSFSFFKLDGNRCAFDESTNSFFYPIKQNSLDFTADIEIEGSVSEIYINDELVDNLSSHSFGTVEVNQVIPLHLVFCDSSGQDYQLVFTRLPIIQIQLDGISIYDDPKQAVRFYLHDPDYQENGQSQAVFSSTIGIEVRGAGAQVYPKKSYGLELWADDSGTEKIDAPLLGMRNDDDWILDAMYIDRSKMRNRVSTDIWLDFSSLYYQDQEPRARAGNHGKLVEVFIDNHYHGLYTFAERMDRKLLQLKKSDEQVVKGLLYKAVLWSEKIVKFENYFPSDPGSPSWDGWEQKYPDPEESIIWKPLDNFTKFVLTSSDDDFVVQVGEKLWLENTIDYFILLNLIRGDDNTGKNVYFSKYKNRDKFFIVPWDMDATWGRDFIAYETSSQGILSNGLFDRLLATNPDDFRNQLKQRWFALRNETLSNDHLKSYFDQYASLLEDSGAFEREKNKWNLNHEFSPEISYIKGWIDDRLVFLDDYYQML